MKISRFAIAVCYLTTLLASQSLAAIKDGFFLEPFLTAEYSAPRMSGNGQNSSFKTNDISKQLLNFENIALGFHGRIHKYAGININWAQTDLSTTELEGYVLSKKAGYGLDHYNFSTVFFAPLVEDSVLEIFGEIGVSDMRSKISIFDSSNTYFAKRSHETKAFIGAGLQIALSKDANDAIKMSFLRYVGKIALIDTNLNLVRLGYIKSF